VRKSVVERAREGVGFGDRRCYRRQEPRKPGQRADRDNLKVAQIAPGRLLENPGATPAHRRTKTGQG
jgi:hypothetical protein